MKKLLLAIVMVVGVTWAWAQSPTPEPDTVRDPMKQTDPELKQLPRDLHDPDKMVRINAEELPPAVLESLKSAEYKSWKKSVVYKRKSDNAYVVEVRDGGKQRVYYFDKNGKRIHNRNKAEKNVNKR